MKNVKKVVREILEIQKTVGIDRNVLTNPLFKDGESSLKKFESIIMNPSFGLSCKDK